MRKTVFANAIFRKLLVSFIVILLLYNIYTAFVTGNVYGLLPIFIQILLLVLIFLKSEYTRMAILVWAVVLLIANGGEVVAELLDGDVMTDSKLIPFIFQLVQLILSILIFDYTKRTVNVATVD